MSKLLTGQLFVCALALLPTTLHASFAPPATHINPAAPTRRSHSSAAPPRHGLVFAEVRSPRQDSSSSPDGGDSDGPSAGGPPVRRTASVPSPAEMPQPLAAPAGTTDAGFVFGKESVDAAVEALRSGSIVLLTEDGEEVTRGMLVVSPDVSSEQLQFVLEHAERLQAALEPDSYRAVYRSLQKIVLDNNNLAQPALSVSARNAGRSPRDARGIAKTIAALMATDWSKSSEEAGEDGSGSGSSSSGSSSSEFYDDVYGSSGRDAEAEISTSLSALVCPGAISLGSCREGGVLRRAGATEACLELAKLAGLGPNALGLHANVPSTSLAALRAFAARWELPVSSTADLVAYARRRELLIERCGPPAKMPTKHGRFVAHTYRSRVDGTEHIALVKTRDPGVASKLTDDLDDNSWSYDGDAIEEERPFADVERPALVRVHSECCTGDIFGSLRCDCGPQLDKALQDIEEDGWGVLLYLRGQEGRGIGLGAKMHAYALQERGYDTQDANIKLGLPVDSREYGTGAQILADLGITDMRLMSNNPKKFTGLAGYGLRIVERVPSLVAANPENLQYLQTKVTRMGHMLDNSRLAADVSSSFFAADVAASASLGADGEAQGVVGEEVVEEEGEV